MKYWKGTFLWFLLIEAMSFWIGMWIFAKITKKYLIARSYTYAILKSTKVIFGTSWSLILITNSKPTSFFYNFQKFARNISLSLCHKNIWPEPKGRVIESAWLESLLAIKWNSWAFKIPDREEWRRRMFSDQHLRLYHQRYVNRRPIPDDIWKYLKTRK